MGYWPETESTSVKIRKIEAKKERDPEWHYDLVTPPPREIKAEPGKPLPELKLTYRLREAPLYEELYKKQEVKHGDSNKPTSSIRYVPPSPEQVEISEEQLRKAEASVRTEENFIRMGGYYSAEAVRLGRKNAEGFRYLLERAKNGYYYCGKCKYQSIPEITKCPKCGAI